MVINNYFVIYATQRDVKDKIMSERCITCKHLKYRTI